jgi:signal transduction histidine kinase
MLSESVARYASLVEDTLRQESASKDRFIAILSHELRNPLNALVAASTLLDNGGDKDQVRHVLRRQTGHLKRLLDDLLDLSRIVLNLVSLQVECVELQSCIEDALIATGEIIERKNQTLTVQMPDQPIVIEADCTRVTQIVTNLVNNAAKHSPAGSHIDVAVRHDGHKVEISVRDDGPGINADQLPHLFTRFHESTKREARNLSGLGIGLWLSRTLAELHGGHITAKSDGPGTGSEFLITLPRVSAPQAQH